MTFALLIHLAKFHRHLAPLHRSQPVGLYLEALSIYQGLPPFDRLFAVLCRKRLGSAFMLHLLTSFFAEAVSRYCCVLISMSQRTLLVVSPFVAELDIVCSVSRGLW